MAENIVSLNPEQAEELPALEAVTIPVALLKAALIVAGKGDIRHYLNAVRIEAAGDELRVVASDGHRLFIASAQGEAQALPVWTTAGVNIGREWLTEALGLIGKLGAEAVIEWAPGHPRAIVRDAAGLFAFRIGVEEGQFPDWRRVVADQSGALAMDGQALDAGAINPDYLRGAGQVASALSASTCTPFTGRKESAVMFAFECAWPAMLYVMPMRNEGAVSDATLRLVGPAGLRGSIAALRAYHTRLKSNYNVAKNETQRSEIEGKMAHTMQRIENLTSMADTGVPALAAA